MDALSQWFPGEALPGAWRIVVGGLLYLFLLQLFWLMRRDLQRAESGARTTLTLIEAPAEVLASGLQVGQVLVVESPATFGREPGNTVVIPAQTVSANHLRLVYRNGGWWVEDLGSTNGTFVNGEPVGTITRLAGDDVVGCGPQVRFRLLGR